MSDSSTTIAPSGCSLATAAQSAGGVSFPARAPPGGPRPGGLKSPPQFLPGTTWDTPTASARAWGRRGGGETSYYHFS